MIRRFKLLVVYGAVIVGIMGSAYGIQTADSKDAEPRSLSSMTYEELGAE